MCELQQWEAAECPKLGSTFKKIIIKVGEIDHLLMEWLREPNLSHEQRLRIIGLVNAVNEIPPRLRGLGFPYNEVLALNRGAEPVGNTGQRGEEHAF